MATVAVTDATFDEEVRNSDVPVVVDFWAEWCGPCKQIGPILEELSDEMAGKVKVAKVDVDANQNAAMSMAACAVFQRCSFLKMVKSFQIAQALHQKQPFKNGLRTQSKHLNYR